MAAPPPDRYEPLPSLLELPGFLLRKLSPGWRRAVLTLLGLLALAAVAAAVFALPGVRQDERDREQAAERARRQAFVVRRARAQRLARPRTRTGPAAAGLAGARALRARRALVTGLEAAVLADARVRAGRDERSRRYRSASCFEFPKRLDRPQPQEDLTRTRARYECIAVSSVVPPSERSTGSLIGQPFRAVVDFERGRATWCLIVGRPGELVVERRQVLALSPACGGSG